MRMLKQDLDNGKATATTARDNKAQLNAEALQNAADAKGGPADVTGTRDADTAYRMDTEATCSSKSSALEERHKLRHEEIESLEKRVMHIEQECKQTVSKLREDRTMHKRITNQLEAENLKMRKRIDELEDDVAKCKQLVDNASGEVEDPGKKKIIGGGGAIKMSPERVAEATKQFDR